MRSWTQLFILLAVVVVLVAGLSFVYQALSSKRPPVAAGAPKKTSKRPRTQGLVNFVEIGDPATQEYEVHTEDYEDLWFKNPNATPAELGPDTGSCECA